MPTIQKLLLVSILFATMALPMRAARHPSPVRGFRAAVLWSVGFAVFYMLAVLHVYPRLF